MIRTASFAGAVSVLSLICPAYAQLFSPPLWTDAGNAGACYVRNIGTTPFKVKVEIFSNNGIAPGDIVVDTCNTGPLGAGKTCLIFSAHLPDASWAACSAQAGGSNVSRVRGNFDIRHVSGGAGVVLDADLR